MIPVAGGCRHTDGIFSPHTGAPYLTRIVLIVRTWPTPRDYCVALALGLAGANPAHRMKIKSPFAGQKAAEIHRSAKGGKPLNGLLEVWLRSRKARMWMTFSPTPRLQSCVSPPRALKNGLVHVKNARNVPISQEVALTSTLQSAGSEMSMVPTGKAHGTGANGSGICSGCREPILDRYLLLVDHQPWHSNCLRCSLCSALLGQNERCFSRGGNFFCRRDYVR